MFPVRPVFIALLAAALPGSAGAAGLARTCELPRLDVGFIRPAAGTILHGGESVEIRWSGVPLDAEEVELLLSVDGGHHFSLRLSEELDADSRAFQWRVPNLIADHAALTLRMGTCGREVESAPGPLFALRPQPSTQKALLRWRAEEIWLDAREESDVRERPLPLQGLSAEPKGLTALPRETGAFLPPRTLDPRPALLARKVPSLPAGETACRAVLSSLSRSPHSIPQRI